MRKWVPNGELEQDRTEWAVILADEEFEALGALLAERTKQEKDPLGWCGVCGIGGHDGGDPSCPGPQQFETEAEPIEVGQVWMLDTGAPTSDLYEIAGFSRGSDGDYVLYRRCDGAGVECGILKSRLPENFKRLPFRREEAQRDPS